MRQAEVTYVCTYVQACTCSTYFFIIFKTRIKDILPYSAMVRWGMVPEGWFTVWRSVRGLGGYIGEFPKMALRPRLYTKEEDQLIIVIMFTPPVIYMNTQPENILTKQLLKI